jgi:hypothetical protein
MPLLHLSSQDRDEGTNERYKTFIKSDLRINSRFQVVSVIVPNTYYPVNTNNNTIHWTDSGANDITTTLPVGTYTPGTLATAIGTAMTADSVALDTITWTVNSLLAKLNAATDTASMTILAAGTTAYKVIGSSNTTDQTIATNADMPNIYNTSGCNEYFIRSNFQPREQSYIPSGTSDILLKVPVDQNFGGTVFYLPDHTWFYGSNSRIINSIDMRVTDCDNNIVDLNGQPWGITLWIE